MRPTDSKKPPYVARIEKIEADTRNNVKVKIRWYYRPEESIVVGGSFTGPKSFSSPITTTSRTLTPSKTSASSTPSPTTLSSTMSGPMTTSAASTGDFTPNSSFVYCKCLMPYNPDDFMVQCEACTDWFHPSCMGMSIRQAIKLDHFICSDCSSDDYAKMSPNGYHVSPLSAPKVETKRPRTKRQPSS